MTDDTDGLTPEQATYLFAHLGDGTSGKYVSQSTKEKINTIQFKCGVHEDNFSYNKQVSLADVLRKIELMHEG